MLTAISFKISLIASIGAFLIGSASLLSDSCIGGDAASSRSVFERLETRRYPVSDPRNWYALSGVAKINGNRVAIYALQNGAKPDDSAGPGHGYADVFDSAGHLIRRFAFKENLNSPPRVVEYVSLPAAVN